MPARRDCLRRSAMNSAEKASPSLSRSVSCWCTFAYRCRRNLKVMADTVQIAVRVAQEIHHKASLDIQNQVSFLQIANRLSLLIVRLQYQTSVMSSNRRNVNMDNMTMYTADDYSSTNGPKRKQACKFCHEGRWSVCPQLHSCFPSLTVRVLVHPQGEGV